MILQINKRKALEAISGLRSRIPALKTKEEENRDYQSWKDEADDTVKLIFGDKSSYYTNFHEVLNPSFRPVASVKVAVTDGLCDMVALHTLRVVEVSDGARHLEDAVVGAC